MPMVYITCPVTGNLLATNHIVPDQQHLDHHIDRHVAVPCPFCNDKHIWNDENGFFLVTPDKSNKF